MRTLISGTLVAAGVTALAWWYWKDSTRVSAEAWAAGTDRVR